MAKKRSASTSDHSGDPAASFTYEVILWAVLALSIILFISNFGIAGAVGNFISSIFFGLFGLTAYIFPILLFAGTAFVIANQKNKTAIVKAAAALGFYIFVCMFLELITGGSQSQTPLDSYLHAAEHKSGGGLVGGLLTWLIRPHLGLISAYVIDIIMMIICMVLVTQRSLWKPIRSGSKKVYDSAKNETLRQRQQYQERRQRRMDNKVSGVSTDTSLKQSDSPASSDNVSEIRPDPALLQDFPIYMMNQPRPNQTDTQSKYKKEPVSQEKPQVQQTLAAAGMGYAQVMPFPPAKTEPEPESPDKIIPIKNRKVTLQPNAADKAADTDSAPNMQTLSEPEPADDILARSSDIFSELFPEAEMEPLEEHMQQTDADPLTQAGDTWIPDTNPVAADAYPDRMILKGAAALNDTGNLTAAVSSADMSMPAGEMSDADAGMLAGTASDADMRMSADIANHSSTKALADTANNTEMKTLAGAVNDTEMRMSAGVISPADAKKDAAATQAAGTSHLSEKGGAALWSEAGLTESLIDETDEDDPLPIAPAVSAEELMDQQLRAAAVIPKRVSAVAPVSAMEQAATRQVRQPKQSAAQAASSVADVQMQLAQAPVKIKKEYILPPVDLLAVSDINQTGDTREHLQETALKLQQTLKNFGVNVTILNVSCGPSVTRYEIQPEMGVKVSKIVNLADDIKLNLAAADIRIEAPIPGKAAIGIEVPNKETVPVMFRDLIESDAFRKQNSPCAFAAGKDIAGQVVVTDICKMPHLLIAGATGSGKSVCINTIIMSIIYKANPDDVKLIMIDPKVVELSVYNGIPHLLLPVVTDPKKAAGALHWAVSEMMDRYQKFADFGVRDMKGYNAKVKKIADIPDENKPQKMPYIVIIVDELADLMMAAPGDVEDAICRLAQLARAAGIHLIIATQRPSVNVITGLIKANMPSRIAFSVTSGIDSRTILDMNGAEKLLGKGDMLFYPQGLQKPVRVQGAFVSDTEVSDVVEFLTERNGTSEYNRTIEQQVENAASGSGAVSQDASAGDDRDVYFADAARLLIDKEKASVSMLQRYFKIGFNRAARIMDQLEEAGVVGPEEGTKPRRIIMSPEEFAQYEEEVL